MDKQLEELKRINKNLVKNEDKLEVLRKIHLKELKEINKMLPSLYNFMLAQTQLTKKTHQDLMLLHSDIRELKEMFREVLNVRIPSED